MGKKTSIFPNGLAGKMIKFFIIFVLALGITYLLVFLVQLLVLHNMIKTDEENQLTYVAKQSEEAMTSVTEENLKALIKWASDRTDDEFWIAGHDLKMLRNQVEDIYRNPDNYGRKAVYPPSKENADKPALQLLCDGDYKDISPEAMEKVERLANLEPLLREFLLKNEFNVDIGIATMDGLALDMDRLSKYKVLDDGSIISVDVTTQPWYTGAIERGDIFFYPIHSLLYDFDEVAYAAPVYVDNELVAVLQGSIKTEMLRSFLEGRDLGESGFTILVSDVGELVCSPRDSGELMIPEDISADIRESVNPELKDAINKGLSGEFGVSKVTVDGEEYYAAYGYMRSYKWTQLIFVSVDEVMSPTNELLSDIGALSAQNIKEQNFEILKSALIAVAALAVIVFVAIILVAQAAKKHVKPIAKLADHVAKLSGDNMTFKMDESYKTGDEIELLAESFEGISENIKKFLNEIVTITTEKEKVNAELSLAARIQSDMLPSKFPAFPDRTEFDIYASMTPAKEVGGDFYDFFIVGEDKLAMVMADVSGKGIPAAMFMMMAKTMIQSHLISDYDVHKVLEDINNLICANNREKMFVTVWIGILDLKTGVLTASNAGHEYPIYKDGDSKFEIIKDKHGFVIGGKKNMKYSNYDIVMKPGSKLFVYTDGVPEATDANNELFGMERTLAAVNAAANLPPKDILENVEKEVRNFVGSAEQFDDLTMLCIEYKAK